MRLDDVEQSDDVEDRRGSSGGFGGGGFGGGGGGGLPIGGGGLGIGTIIILGLIGWATGINPMLLIGGAEAISGRSSGSQQYEQPSQQATRNSKPQDETGVFVSQILRSNQDVWTRVLPEQTNVQYERPKLVLFSNSTPSGCGRAQSATGPFYCPQDSKVYLDTSFFDEMATRFGGGGKFADAYVISHEIGHHVQNLLGILPKVNAQQRRVDERTANQLSVKIELMADCLGGVWANKSKDRLKIDESDIQQALKTASAIGDDRLQRQSRGTVVPDSFTHGTSAQRQRWFSNGWQSGDINQCNTFKADQL